MQEKIGKVTLDYEFYPGRDLYSDGPVEEELLEIAKNYKEEELNQVIAKKNSWPILYHFSHIRQNILEWLPITKQDKVLEIGSGCGTIMTGSADVDMITTIIMQTRYLQAGVVRLSGNLHEKVWRRCWRAFLHLKNMA